MAAQRSAFERVKEKLVSYYGETMWTDQVAQDVCQIVRSEMTPEPIPDSQGLPFDASQE